MLKDRRYIQRFEEYAMLLKLTEVPMQIQFMSLFSGKALDTLHHLDSTVRTYDDMIMEFLQMRRRSSTCLLA